MPKPHYSFKLLIALVVLVGCLGNFASDVYAPSIPAIASDLHSPIAHVQWTMALYMLGVALSLFFYGPISEGVGRKPPLIGGLCIMLIGTLICWFAPNMTILLIGRFIQGCGGGASTGLWRTIFRDMFSGDDLAKYASYLTIFIIFIIPAAPTVGGYLTQYVGWRSIFAFITFYILVALWMVCVHYQETSQHHHRNHLKLPFILMAFKSLGTSRIYMGYASTVLLTFGALFSWYTIGPVLLIDQLSLSPVAFGWYNVAMGVVAMSIGGFVNAKLVKRYGAQTLLQIGWLLMFLAGCILAITQLLCGVSVLGIIIPMLILYFGTTLVWPNAFSKAMTPFGHIAGYAGTMYSALQLGGGALMAAIAAHTPDTSQYPLAAIFAGSALLAWLIYRVIIGD